MKQIKITVVKMTEYKDLSILYENKIDIPCSMKLNAVYYSNGVEIPDGFCKVAWNILLPFINDLIDGKESFPNWMRDKSGIIISLRII